MNTPVRRIAFLLALAWAFTGMGPAHADRLFMQDGETLTGELVEVGDSAVVFETAYAGLMIVPVGEVAGLQTDAYWSVELSDGRRLVGRFVHQRGHTLVQEPESSHAVPAALPHILAASSVEAEVQNSLRRRETESAQHSTGLEGAAAIGVWSRSDAGAQAFLRAMLRQGTEAYAFASDLWLELAGGGDFPSYADVMADWRMAPDADYGPVFHTAFARDARRGLALRSRFGLGVNRRIRLGSGQSFAFSGGLAASAAFYDEELLPGAPRWRFRNPLDREYYRTEDEQELAGFLRLDHELPLIGGIRWTNTIRLDPSLTDFGNLTARSESALRFPLTSRLELDLSWIVDYDSRTRFEDVDRWNSAVGASLRWGF